jgi:hypothetical protein
MRSKEYSKPSRPFWRFVVSLYPDAGETELFNRVYAVLSARVGGQDITHRSVLLTLMSSFLEVEGKPEFAPPETEAA